MILRLWIGPLAPPFGLPPISPSEGEIGGFASIVFPAAFEIGESRRDD
jgi:hypothetical protein